VINAAIPGGVKTEHIKEALTTKPALTAAPSLKVIIKTTNIADVNAISTVSAGRGCHE